MPRQPAKPKRRSPGRGSVTVGVLACRIRQELKARGSGRLRGFEFIGKSAKSDHLTVDRDRRSPSSISTVPTDATILRRGSGVTWLILGLLPLSNNPEIASPVVQPVEINMIAFTPVIHTWKTKQLSVKANTQFAATDRRSATCVPVSGQAPPPLARPLSIGGVYDGVGADGAVFGAQRDQPIKAISSQGNRRRSLLADLTAIVPYLDAAGLAAKRLATDETSTLNGHRLSPSGGVLRPDIASNNVGLSCFNFTIRRLNAAI